jgi:uncharacterized LabA/DUF88 family protein
MKSLLPVVRAPSQVSALAGFISWGVGDPMVDRVAVFIDYQNVYCGAREAFCLPHEHHIRGQVDPRLLADLIVSRRKFDSELSVVRVYRGQPDSERDRRGYAACRRQSSRWTQDDKTRVITRTLRYPYGWPDRSPPGEKPQEKGIDVALAVDYVMMAVQNQCDVGIIMTTDTDLKPALEAVTRLNAVGRYPHAEVAAWQPLGDRGQRRRLSITQKSLWCHWLDHDAFKHVADDTNYATTRPATSR